LRYAMSMSPFKQKVIDLSHLPFRKRLLNQAKSVCSRKYPALASS
jgi:hypothetical protein